MNSSSDQELRALIDERVAAVHARDLEGLLQQLHPDVVSFNVLPPLHARGREAVAAQARSWFDSYAGDIGYEVRDVEVSAEQDVGFCSFLYHVSGRLVGGQQVDMWVRASLGCRRVDGRWLITHDHESVPFDPETGQALINLQP